MATSGSRDVSRDWEIIPKFAKDPAGNPVITDLQIKAKTDQAKKFGLNANILRSIRFTDLIQDFEENEKDIIEQVMRFHPDFNTVRKEWLKSIKGQWPSSGQNPHPEWMYARVSFFYAEIFRKNKTSPIKELATLIDVNIETAGRRIEKAKNLDLLTRPAKQKKGAPTGKSGSQLTNKCLNILNSETKIEVDTN